MLRGPLPTRYYPRAGSLELQVILEVALLQAVAQGGHEAACVGAVDDLVVVGQRQEDHVADRDGLVLVLGEDDRALHDRTGDRKSTRLNSSHVSISYAVFCFK